MLLSTHHKMDVWEDVWVTDIVVGLNSHFVCVAIQGAGIGLKKRNAMPRSSGCYILYGFCL